MNYAIIENNKVTNLVVAEPEYAAEQGWVGPITRESKITFGWGYVNGKFVEPPRDIEAEWEAVRIQRDQLLLESDVYVLPDRWAAMTTEEQTAWSEYRQALRDIPQVYTDPADVIWPTNPNDPKEEPLLKDLDPSDPDFIMEDPSDYGLDPNNLPQ